MNASIAPLQTSEECVAASALLARIWGTSLESAPLTSDLIRSLVHSGACVLAAHHDDQIIGVAIGVFGAPESRNLYSLIAAVDPRHASQGVGQALKMAQRQWALQRGVTSMIWTFDPLIRRNAHFNLNRLGAEVIEFVESFYPPMHDAVNHGDEPDRLTVRWDLEAAHPSSGARAEGDVLVDAGEGERPRRTALTPRSDILLARVPHDIERLRREHPEAAAQWRLALREVLRETRSHGYRISGFSRTGHYVFERAHR